MDIKNNGKGPDALAKRDVRLNAEWRWSLHPDRGPNKNEWRRGVAFDAGFSDRENLASTGRSTQEIRTRLEAQIAAEQLMRDFSETAAKTVRAMTT